MESLRSQDQKGDVCSGVCWLLREFVSSCRWLLSKQRGSYRYLYESVTFKKNPNEQKNQVSLNVIKINYIFMTINWINVNSYIILWLLVIFRLVASPKWIIPDINSLDSSVYSFTIYCTCFIVFKFYFSLIEIIMACICFVYVMLFRFWLLDLETQHLFIDVCTWVYYFNIEPMIFILRFYWETNIVLQLTMIVYKVIEHILIFLKMQMQML